MDNQLTPQTAHRASVTWPILLISLGVLLLFNEFVPGWGIERTWPVVLVIIGVLLLLQSTRPPRAPRGPSI